MAIASLAAFNNTLGSAFQGLYGFVVPYVRRGVILGIGNCLWAFCRGQRFRIELSSFFATDCLVA